MTADRAAIPWPTVGFPALGDEAKAASRRATLAERPAASPVWVFGYGSLMWQPCFAPAERRTGTIDGFRRSFCFWTVIARGTPERPGLGLGLEAVPARRCHGVAFRLSEETLDRDLAALWDREMHSGVYRPRWVEVALGPAHGGEGEQRETRVPAIAFVADPAHPQYCPPLTPDQQAEIIAGACGKFGPCADYLENVVRHLAAFGEVEPEIEALRARVAELRAGRKGALSRAVTRRSGP